MPYKCYICGEVGHNKRTCKKKLVEPIKAPETPTKVVVEEEECPICYNELGKRDLCVTKCGHKFCMDCTTKHLCNSKACPMCRRDIVDKIISTGPPEHGPGSIEQISQDCFDEGYDEGYWRGSKTGRECAYKDFAQVMVGPEYQTVREREGLVIEMERLKKLLEENYIEY